MIERGKAKGPSLRLHNREIHTSILKTDTERKRTGIVQHTTAGVFSLLLLATQNQRNVWLFLENFLTTSHVDWLPPCPNFSLRQHHHKTITAPHWNTGHRKKKCRGYENQWAYIYIYIGEPEEGYHTTTPKMNKKKKNKSKTKPN